MIWILFWLVKMRKGLKAFPKTSKTKYKFMFRWFLCKINFFFFKDPVLWNIVPKCMNSLTISNSILFILRLKFIGNLPEELQSELNYFYEYCEKWNLKVNTNKSKVMFFSKGRLPINFNLKIHRLNMGKLLKQNRYKQFLILYYYTGLKLHCTFYPLYYT
jgi:hypothetical protein